MKGSSTRSIVFSVCPLLSLSPLSLPHCLSSLTHNGLDRMCRITLQHGNQLAIETQNTNEGRRNFWRACARQRGDVEVLDKVRGRGDRREGKRGRWGDKSRLKLYRDRMKVISSQFFDKQKCEHFAFGSDINNTFIYPLPLSSV
jgi:hypothetical protein